jgi:hypothetical protein
VAAANLIATDLDFGGGPGRPEREALLRELSALDMDEQLYSDLAGRLPGDLENLLSLIGERP